MAVLEEVVDSIDPVRGAGPVVYIVPCESAFLDDHAEAAGSIPLAVVLGTVAKNVIVEVVGSVDSASAADTRVYIVLLGPVALTVSVGAVDFLGYSIPFAPLPMVSPVVSAKAAGSTRCPILIWAVAPIVSVGNVESSGSVSSCLYGALVVSVEAVLHYSVD